MVEDVTFGQRLRRARLVAGFSQSELEERSGIPKARLSRYENGHVLPSLGTLQKLASSLSVSEATLLGDHRAVLEGFFEALQERGVRIDSTEKAERLANAVADIALSIEGDRPKTDRPKTGGRNETGLALGASNS
jgi:transcriptional regulator with XRE-family HTH domain